MNLRGFANPFAAFARFVAGAQAVRTAPAPDPGQVIYYANHTSHLDFIVLWASLPRGVRACTRPVAAQDYWSSGIKRDVAVGVFNAILVPRAGHGGAAVDPRETIARIARDMGDVDSVIIFPEGTRGDGEDVQPFKSGIYHLCRAKPNVPALPVYIENLNRILPKGEFVPVPFVSRLYFGAPLVLEAAESKDAFLGRAHEALCALRPA